MYYFAHDCSCSSAQNSASLTRKVKKGIILYITAFLPETTKFFKNVNRKEKTYYDQTDYDL